MVEQHRPTDRIADVTRPIGLRPWLIVPILLLGSAAAGLVWGVVRGLSGGLGALMRMVHSARSWVARPWRRTGAAVPTAVSPPLPIQAASPAQPAPEVQTTPPVEPPKPVRPPVSPEMMSAIQARLGDKGDSDLPQDMPALIQLPVIVMIP